MRAVKLALFHFDFPAKLHVLVASNNSTVVDTSTELGDAVLVPLEGDLIFQQWGHPILDLFATRFNTKCATFVSLTPDHRAVFTDALAMSWEGIFACAFPSPPANLLPGHPEIQPNRTMSPHFGGHILAQTSVVRGSTEADGGQTHSSSPMGENAEVAKIQCVSP